MTASSHSSKTTPTDHEKDHDPEALGKDKVEDALTKDNANANEQVASPWEVTLEKSEDPKTMGTWSKWLIVSIISAGAMFVTCASSMAGATRHICLRSDLTRPYL
jgi:hypothetical protein